MTSKDWGHCDQLLRKARGTLPVRPLRRAGTDQILCAVEGRQPGGGDRPADRFIKLYPNHPNVDYAYYLKGLVNFNENTGLLSGLANPDMSERIRRARATPSPRSRI